MKKATLTVLLALCLALLLTACGGEETISGRITEYLRGDAGVNGFLMERDGLTVGVRLDEKSGIYPDLVIITEKALRDAEYPGMGVTVTGEPAAEKLTAADGTEVPTYLASSVIIDSIPYGEPLTLEDGTRIAVRLNRYGPAYYAPDGMLLFQEDNQTPGDIFMDRVDFDIVSKEVQDKIYARYRELGNFTMPNTRWSAPGRNIMSWAAPGISGCILRTRPPAAAATMTGSFFIPPMWCFPATHAAPTKSITTPFTTGRPGRRFRFGIYSGRMRARCRSGCCCILSRWTSTGGGSLPKILIRSGFTAGGTALGCSCRGTACRTMTGPICITSFLPMRS